MPNPSRTGRPVGDPPSLQTIQALIGEDRTRNGARRAKLDRLLSLYFQDYTVAIPEEFKSSIGEVKSTTIEEHHRAAWAILTEGSPSVNMVPQILGSESIETAKQRANLVEAWDNAAWPQLEKQSGRPVFANLMWWALWDEAICLVEYAPDMWEEYDRAVTNKAPRDIYDDATGKRRREKPKERDKRLQRLKQGQPLPFYVRDLDPRSVGYWTDHKGIKQAIWRRTRTRVEVAEQYGRRVGTVNGSAAILPAELGDGGTPSDQQPPATGWGTVEFVTHWTRPTTDPATGEHRPGWVTYYADGVILDQRPYQGCRVPIFVAAGLRTPLDRPEQSSRSLMDTFASLVEEESRLMTAMGAYAWLSAFPMLVDEADANNPTGVGNDARPKKPIKWTPGATIRMPNGRTLRPMVLPDVGQTIQKQLGLIQAKIDRYSPIAPVLRGMAPGDGVESGYAVNQVRQEARTKFQPLLGGISGLIEDVLAYIHYLVDEVCRDTVYVAGIDPKDERKQSRMTLGLGPDQLRGYYVVNVSIRTEAPQADIALMRAGIEAWKAGLITKEYCLEYFAKIPNAAQMIEDKFLEDLWDDPRMKQWFLEELIKRNQMQQDINNAAANAGQDVPGPAGALNTNPQGGMVPPGGMVDAGSSNGMGLGPAAPLPPVGPPPGGGPSLGGLAGVQIQPNTAALPGGTPVGV